MASRLDLAMRGEKEGEQERKTKEEDQERGKREIIAEIAGL